MNATPSPSRRRRVARRVVGIGACAAAAATFGVSTASAAPTNVTTTVTHLALRLVDEEHGLLLFVNKSRADLCTPERLEYETLLLEWFDGGGVGDPPAEPAGTTEGEAEVTTTSRVVGGRQLVSTTGDDLPVEVWRLDDEGDGIDCGATDGPGAELFASGPMDLTVSRNISDRVQTGETKVAGIVTAPDGSRWNLSVDYLLTSAGQMFQVKPVLRLVALP